MYVPQYQAWMILTNQGSLKQSQLRDRQQGTGPFAQTPVVGLTASTQREHKLYQ